MKLSRIQQLRGRLFSVADIARVFGISHESARVLATRYTQSGIFLKIKRNLYILADEWEHLSLEKKFQIANLLQVPSYISLLSALAYYEITTQIPINSIESIAIKRTREFYIQDTVFYFIKIKKPLYFGFYRTNHFFIAEPEKAILDALYLQNLRRYHIDIDTIDWARFNWEKLSHYANAFPEKIKQVLLTYEPIRNT